MPLITIIDVEGPVTNPTKTGRTYESIEVTYKDDQGNAKTKKLMSFNHPEVFKALKGAQKGDKFNITAQKNDAGYWDWVSVGKGDEPVASEAPVRTGGKVTGSNYETAEERAKRQVYIVRQSSIANAIALLSVGAKSHPAVDDVLTVAKSLEAFVFSTGPETTIGSIDALIAIDDDVPL